MSDYDEMQGLNFDRGPVTVVAVDNRTSEVLTVGHMNREALKRTMDTGYVNYYSTSKGRIRMKGETSGNIQILREIYRNCDGRTLLVRVDQKGPACHTGNRSCFFGKIGESDGPVPGINYSLDILRELESVIEDRKHNPDENSYTSSLFAKGKEEIYKKFGEEAVEILLAEGKERTVYESADMLYHFLVLLSLDGIKLDEVMAELAGRRK